MALKSPTGFNTTQLLTEIQNVYSKVAENPSGDFHFHRGPVFAAELLDYDPAELAKLPTESTSSFAGVANPLAIGDLNLGETVVDIGCGAGMDLLLAANRVGPEGKAIGVDMTPAMLVSATKSAEAMGASHVETRRGNLAALPLDDDSVDVVISNGVMNLAPDKTKAVGEIARVLKPGGRLYLGDFIMGMELDEANRGDIDLWTG